MGTLFGARGTLCRSARSELHDSWLRWFSPLHGKDSDREPTLAHGGPARRKELEIGEHRDGGSESGSAVPEENLPGSAAVFRHARVHRSRYGPNYMAERAYTKRTPEENGCGLVDR